MAVLTLKNLKLEKRGVLLFNVDKLTIEQGDIIGLIGKNGSGKTSLLKVLSGENKNFSGDILGETTVFFNELNLTDGIIKSGGEETINVFLSTFYSIHFPVSNCFSIIYKICSFFYTHSSIFSYLFILYILPFIFLFIGQMCRF